MNTPNPYAPPQATVADVADPNATAERASRGTRLLAAIVDGIVFSFMVYLPIGIGMAVAGISDATSIAANPFLLLKVGGPFALLGIVVWGVITYRLVKRNGQTIAKKWMSIKVVRSDGAHASVGRIFWLRNVVNSLLAFIPLVGALYGLLDALWIFGEQRRCIHDLIADTIVVKA